MRILLVEDERKIASFIKRGLREEHYLVDIAYDGEKAHFLASVNPYDLVILDLMLPDKSGVVLCGELRKGGMDSPILMLTAKDTVKDKITGLNAGADDYLTKPFAFDELLARVRVLLRRKKPGITTALKVADLELNQLTRKVARSGKEIPLTAKEYSLLEYMMLNANTVITRTMISEHVWNENFDSFTNVIDVYVNYLRNKIDKKPFGKKLIHTVRGTGYIMKE